MESGALPPQQTPEDVNPDEVQRQPPEVPHVDPPATAEDVAALHELLKEYRAEVAKFRQEAQDARQAPREVVAIVETLEDRTNARLEAIANASHYCPGCGKLGNYPQKCEGTREGPHLPIEMVSTEELAGDPANHTAAPNTDKLAA